MNKSKHMKPKTNKTEKNKVSANYFEKPLAVFEYDETPKKKPFFRPGEVVKIPRAIYRAGAILLVIALGLGIWMNRENLRPENLKTWFLQQLRGNEVVEGFPVPIKGNQVQMGNFMPSLNNCAILSDTTLSVLDGKGSERTYIRHSFANPALRTASGYYLIYNTGMKGYLLSTGSDVQLNKEAADKIYFANVAPNGTFALGMQGEEYASVVEIYKKDGKPLYKYSAKSYGTAVVLNDTGTMGAICTVDSEGGTLYSKILVLDFTKDEPVLTYKIQDNMVFDLFWTAKGKIMAIGESGVSVLSTKQNEQVDYDFDGRQVTAYAQDLGKLYVGVSGYTYGGSGSVLLFSDELAAVQTLDFEHRVTSVSAFGSSFAVLTDEKARFYDNVTLKEMGQADAGGDAKALVLGSESSAYVLGASEIRGILARNQQIIK